MSSTEEQEDRNFIAANDHIDNSGKVRNSRSELKDNIEEMPDKINYEKYDEKLKARERKKKNKGKSLLTIDKDALKFVIRNNEDPDEDDDNMNEFSVYYVFESFTSIFQSNYHNSFKAKNISKKCLVITLRTDRMVKNHHSLSLIKNNVKSSRWIKNVIIVLSFVFFSLGCGIIIKKVNSENKQETKPEENWEKILVDAFNLYQYCAQKEIRARLESLFNASSNNSKDYKKNCISIDDNSTNIQEEVVTIISHEIYSIFHNNFREKLTFLRKAIKDNIKNPFKICNIFFMILSYLLTETGKFIIDVIYKFYQLTAILVLTIIYIFVIFGNWLLSNANENITNFFDCLIPIFQYSTHLSTKTFNIISSKDSRIYDDSFTFDDLDSFNSDDIHDDHDNDDINDSDLENDSLTNNKSLQDSFNKNNNAEIRNNIDSLPITNLNEDESKAENNKENNLKDELEIHDNNTNIANNYLNKEFIKNPYENIIEKDIEFFYSKSIFLLKLLISPHYLIKDLLLM